MYDEVMQLIQLAKNDEKYFKRIEELKEKQLEVAQVLEIAKTLGEADKHMALAKQQAAQIIKEAEEEAISIKEAAKAHVDAAKAAADKATKIKDKFAQKELELSAEIQKNKDTTESLEKKIKEHREYTELRTVEYNEYIKLKKEFDFKLKQMREIANS